VPGITADALQFDIRDDRTHAERLAGKIDAERVPYQTAPAVGADQVMGAHDPASGLRGDAFGVLRKAGQLPPELRLVAELGETLAHHRFGQELRDHQGRAIRLGRRGPAGVVDWRIDKTAVRAVFAYRRIRASGREQPVDDAIVLEHFEAARLDALAARAAERRLCLLDQPEGDAAPSEVDRERQAGRPGATDQHVGGGFLRQAAPLNMCIIHICATGGPSRRKVRNTHMSDVRRRLHEALLDVLGIFNRPQNDVILLREAGVSLDRALFPLLVLIQRRGPLGVGELADWVGRDYTTVSRQVAKLESLGLVARRASKVDRRVTEAVVTEKGQAMSEMLDAARERLARNALAGWSEHDLEDLARLLGRFADNLMHRPGDP
jgi:DNA-binding MarR family transcriptional regulator